MKAGIFNDVIGPVMRGPSSSHTAAAHRIGTLVRQLLPVGGSTVVVEFDRNGSLATTYEGQGSAMGLIGGLSGISILDPEITGYRSLPEKHNFRIEFRIADFQASHPNTYRIRVKTMDNQANEITAISTGGGMIEIADFNGFRISMRGDCHETLACFNAGSGERIDRIIKGINCENEEAEVTVTESENQFLLRIRSRVTGRSLADKFLNDPGIIRVWHTDPVLPVMSAAGIAMPFRSPEEMVRMAGSGNLTMAEMAVMYESTYAAIDPLEVISMMKDIVGHVRNSITNGLKDNSYPDRILGHQSHLIREAERSGIILRSPLNTIITYVTAIMESKSSMEPVVAAPTAGSCGALGGALFAVAENLNKANEELINAYFAAGLTGVFIADRYTFAAEEGGCQVECGAASAMAASGLVQLMGGNAEQAVNAASMALQNCLGLICDPVADRVEVPCLGKNILAATNALNCANMSIAGFDPVIPLAEVIEAMKSVGDELPRTLCCTGLGGLSQTPASRRIIGELKRNELK